MLPPTVNRGPPVASLDYLDPFAGEAPLLPQSDWQTLRAAIENQGLRVQRRGRETRSAILSAVDCVSIYEVASPEGEVLAEGKGETDARALYSALGEAAERLLAKTPQGGTPWLAKADELRAKGMPFPHLTCGMGDLYSPDLPLEWIAARTGDGRNGALPAELAYYPFDPATGVKAFSLQHTAGLAAGSSIAGAARAGLLECIETDAYWLSMRTKHVAAHFTQLEDAPDALIRNLSRQLESAGIRVHAGLISFDWPIPIVHVVLETTGETLPALAHGLGSAETTVAALRKALLEAVQVFTGLEKVSLEYWPDIAVGSGEESRPAIAWSSRAFSGRITEPLLNSPAITLNSAPAPTLKNIKELNSWALERGFTPWVASLGEFEGLTTVRVLLDGAVTPFTERDSPSDRVLAVASSLGLRYPYLDPVLT